MKARAGHTLLELILGLGLLVLLMVMMFFVYQMGANSWKKGETSTELLQQVQMVTGRLEREVERSIYGGVALDPGPAVGTAVAFPSCWDDVAARYDYDPVSRSPVWHKYLVCYYDAGAGAIFWKEIPFMVPSPVATPLPGLAAARTGGRLLARNVTACDFRLSEQMLELNLTLEKKRYGSETPERIQIPAFSYFRN